MRKNILCFTLLVLSVANACYGQILREVKMEDSSTRALIIWLKNPSEQFNLKDIGKVKGKNTDYTRKNVSFEEQLNRLLEKTAADDGNMLYVASIGGGGEIYKMKGYAYSTSKSVFDSLKNKIAADRNERLKNCAYLTVYRTKNGDISDLSGITVGINDTGSHKFKAGTFYTIRITNAGDYEVKTKKAKYKIAVAPGNEYYVKIDARNAPSPMAVGTGVVMIPIHNGVITNFRSVDADRGAIECSLLKELE